jgi:hypothetical protein
MSVDEAGRPSSFWLEDVRLRAWPGEPKRGGKTWVFSVADGHYQQELFRRAADDDASTGFAVLAAPRFSNRPGYLLGNLYTLAVPPGQHRGTHYQF